MLEWEAYFEPHILDRGRNYYRKGAVKHISRQKDSDRMNVIEAVVEGSEYYKVRIQYDGHHILDGYCSCPYATDGSYCKHMAAVLYEADADAGNESESLLLPTAGISFDIDTANAKSIAELIAEADREQLAQILLGLANNDDKIESHIRAQLSGLSPVADITELEKAVDSIFLAYSGRGGFIDYHSAFDFAQDLSLYLENETERLFDDGDHYTAFEISKYAYVKLGNWDIDDDGEIMTISDTCFQIWQKAVMNCSDSERAMIKEWFVEHSEDGTVIDYMEDVLKDFLKYELATNEELREEINHLDGLIEESKGSSKCKTVFSSIYGHWIEALNLRLILMKKAGADEKEVDEFRRKYMCFQSVREYYMKKAREDGNTEEEIRLLNESKILDVDAYLVHSYSRRLIELYHAMNDKVSEKEERKQDFLSYQLATKEDFTHYREMCSKEEWHDERRELINSRDNTEMRCELLAEESLLSELYETISSQKNKIAFYNKYGYLLAENYSEPILQEYGKYVSSIADYARNRSSYDELGRYLRRMQEYTGGKKMVTSLCRKWINQYPTRKVMLQELEVFL